MDVIGFARSRLGEIRCKVRDHNSHAVRDMQGKRTDGRTAKSEAMKSLVNDVTCQVQSSKGVNGSSSQTWRPELDSIRW